MKNFVKLIQQAHAEKFSTVMNKIMTKKIPVAFLLISEISQAVEVVTQFRAGGLNVTHLFTSDFKTLPTELDFKIVQINDTAQFYLQSEYIFVLDCVNARVALKIFPKAKVINLDRGNTDEVYESFMAHLDELQKFYESLIDEESKKTFLGYWLGCISNQIGRFVYSNEVHRLISGFIPSDGAVIIEAGTYDGGTATIFSEMGYKVYSFEMDKINYERSRKIAEENNFIIENFALGSFRHETNYTPSGSESHIDSQGANKTQVITLDSYVRKNGLSHVDLISLDVEGAELDILRGAATTIARFKPILVLSAYHKLDDFWTLMNFVKSIRPDYEFALRHSYDTSESLPLNFSEERINYLHALNLEIDNRSYNECILFAR